MKKIIVGIDNDCSGAIAALSREGKFVLLEPVRITKDGRRLLLDIPGNQAILKQISTLAGGNSEVMVVCEKQQLNPGFGAKTASAGGRNAEFWRVLTALMGLAHSTLHARTWQAGLLNVFRDSLTPRPDTKKTAELYIADRYPDLDLKSRYNAKQREAITDAMCLALWAQMIQP